MSIYYIINEVVFTFIEGIIILLAFLLLSNHHCFIKNNPLKVSIFLILYTCTCYWATEFVTPGLHTICITLVSISMLSLITKTNIYISFLSVLMILIFFAIIEAITLIAMMSLLKADLQILISTPHVKLIASAITKSMQLLILIPLHNKRFNLFKANLFKKDNYFISSSILQMALLTIILITATGKIRNSFEFLVLIFIIYLLILLLGYFDIKEREKISKIHEKFLIQEEYVKNMEVVIDVIRKEKHDFANHMNTINAICLLNKPDAINRILQYTKKLTQHMDSIQKFFNTGNNYVDGLLAVKSYYAQEHGIHFDVDFDDPISEIEVDDIDLTSILGNIIDNAFDALLLHPLKKQGIVSIYSYKEADRHIVCISNNGIQIPEQDLNKIFEKKYSTKNSSEEKEERGFGLFITKQLVEKNDGQISVSSTETETEFILEFKLKKDIPDIKYDQHVSQKILKSHHL